MQKLKYKGTYIYVDDSNLDDKETGIVIKQAETHDSQQIRIINDKDLLEDTNVDIFGDNDNE